MNDLIGSPGDQIIVWAMNVLIQVTFIATFALAIGVALRRSPAARYWVFCSALVLTLLCPIFSAVVQWSGMGLISVSLIQDTPLSTKPHSDVMTTSLTDPSTADHSIQKTSQSLEPQEVTKVDTTKPQLASSSQQMPDELVGADRIVVSTLPPLIVSSTTKLGRFLRIVVPPGLIIWPLGALLLLIQIVVKWNRLSLLLKSARKNTNENYADLFHQAWLALTDTPGRKAPELVFSNEVSGPAAAGIRSPKVVLPELLMEQVSAEQLRSILIHEAAHIARGDQLVVLLQNIIGALFWVHPLVRLLNRQVAQAREEVCDNYVLATTDASTYSLTLLTLAQLLNSPRTISGTVGLFTSRWRLEQRVAGLLDEQRSRVTRLSKSALALIGAISVGLITIVTFGTVSLAVAENVEAETAQKTALNQSKSPNVPAKSAAVDDKTKATKAAADQHFVYNGRVVNSQGQPIDGATINVVHTSIRLINLDSEGIVSSHKQLKKVRTDADGKFRIEFDDWWTHYHRKLKKRRPQSISGAGPGTIIVATAPGYAPEWISTLNTNQDKSLQITLRENTVPIRGHLVNQEGLGAAGLTVSLVSLWSTKSGAVDRWLQDLPKLRKQGVLPSIKDNMMQDSYRSTAGMFPVDKQVTASTPGIPTTFKTDREGRFQISDIGADRLAILKITGPNIATQLIAVVTRNMQPVQARPIAVRGPADMTYYGADFTLVTEPGLVVEGVVRDRVTGAPIAARLTVFRIVSRIKRPGYTVNSIRNVDLDCMTDANGKYRIENLPRNCELSLNVIPEGDQPYFRTRFPLIEPDGLEPVTLDVKLRRGIMFRGTLTDKQTGNPIPNAYFNYFPLLKNKNANQYLRYQSKSASVEPMRQRFKSAKNGSFSLVGIPGQGIIAVQINNPDYPRGAGLEHLKDLINKNSRTLKTYDHCSITSYQTLKLVTVPPGKSEMNVDIQADQGASIRFEVVGPDDKPLTSYTINGRLDNNAQKNQSTVNGFHQNQTRTIYFKHAGKHLGRAVTIPGVPNERTIRRIKLEPTGTVKGQLVSDEGSPVTGRKVKILRLAIPGTDSLPNKGYPRIVQQTSCDQEGKFHFQNLLVGAEYMIYTDHKEKYLSDQIKVKPGQTLDLGTIKVPSKK